MAKARGISAHIKIQLRIFFEKKIKFLGFHVVVLRNTFPLMYQLATTVRLILANRDFFSRGTDT